MSGAEAVDLTAFRAREETPGEHLRNCLVLIGAAERHALGCEGWDCEDMRELLHAIERRVWHAIEHLEGTAG